MPKYMMLYKGEATDMADMSEEQANEVGAKWGSWIESVGAGLSDVGTPIWTGCFVG